MKSARKLWWTLLAFCVCLLAYGGYVLVRGRAYARVEKLTEEHAHEVQPFVDQFASRYDLHVVYIKVFEYQATSAKVLVVDKEIALEYADAAGTFFYLARADATSDWELASPPETVWSLAGSADGRTWPPYRLDGPYADTEY